MTRSRLVLAGTAALAAAALILVPTAASGHTDDLFTWAGDEEAPDGFATTSKTDASLALLGGSAGLEVSVITGMEICDEVGYAVGEADGPVLVTWDHDTGAVLADPVPLWIGDGNVAGVLELDTLADCSLLTIAFVNEGYPYLVSVDPTDGELTIIADLGGLDLPPTGIATDAAGTTYLFASDYDAVGQVATVDLATGTIGEWAELSGLAAYYEGGGPLFGVDFDESDGLWMIIGADAQERYRLTSFAAGADLTSATPTDIGQYDFSDEGEVYADPPFPLTAEGHSTPVPPAPKPQLAATGAAAPAGVVLAGGVLLAAGAMLLVACRRAA